MAIFIMISKHTAEDCPIHNEKMRKTFNEITTKAPEHWKKYGIKNLGTWTVIPEHTMYMVFDASAEAFQKCMMEPEMMLWLGLNTTEIKMAVTQEVTTKILQR
ncbi:hypothetical protein MUP00_02895 [Candidatus Bathyarchaeota archaeon]|nr:hypothetical protein [Candidatus Bathyarchaeota archaeon]